jgi:hypothetical protein
MLTSLTTLGIKIQIIVIQVGMDTQALCESRSCGGVQCHCGSWGILLCGHDPYSLFVNKSSNQKAKWKGIICAVHSGRWNPGVSFLSITHKNTSHVLVCPGPESNRGHQVSVCNLSMNSCMCYRYTTGTCNSILLRSIPSWSRAHTAGSQ